MVNKNKANCVVHYIMLYFLLLMNGSMLFRLHEDFFYIAAIAIAIMFMLFGRIKLYKKHFYYIFILFISLLLTCIVSRGSLSIPSILNVISRFLAIYICYAFDEDYAASRFVKISSAFALISLGGYALQLTMPSFVETFSRRITLSTGGMYWSGGSAVNATYYFSYIFNYAAVSHPFKNVGIYFEPGLYGIVLSVTELLLIFFPSLLRITEQQRKKYMIIVAIAAITTGSTTTYVSFAVMIFILALSISKEETRGIRKWITLTMGLLFVLICFDLWQGDNGLIYTNLVSKIFSNGVLDLSASTGKSRIVSMVADLRIMFEYPLGAGFSTYDSIWPSFLSQSIPDTSSCAGLTKALATYGIPTTFILFYYYFGYGLRWTKNKANCMLAAVVVFILNALSQPLIIYPVVMFAFMCMAENNIYKADDHSSVGDMEEI